MEDKKKHKNTCIDSSFHSSETIVRCLNSVSYLHLPQLASSELSPQSFSPSQMNGGRAQRPVPHWKRPGWHLNSAVLVHHRIQFRSCIIKERNQQKKSSVLAKKQLKQEYKPLWPSFGVMQLLTKHSRQSAGSSEPSPQSSTVSHFHQKGMHSSVPQRNC